jgi:high-affinity Fe2+/Pb2+ permease
MYDIGLWVSEGGQQIANTGCGLYFVFVGLAYIVWWWVTRDDPSDPTEKHKP